MLSWRYDGDYASYDLTADDRSSFADPASRYFAIRRREELIGFVCLAAEARVAGMIQDPAGCSSPASSPMTSNYRCRSVADRVRGSSLPLLALAAPDGVVPSEHRRFVNGELLRTGRRSHGGTVELVRSCRRQQRLFGNCHARGLRRAHARERQARPRIAPRIQMSL